MRVIIDVPDHIESYLSYVISERETGRRSAVSPLCGAAKLSRSALLRLIINLGFEGFVVTYPTAESLLKVRGWDKSK